MSLLVHEICHSYVNPIVDRHAAELEPAARPLYRARAGVMRKQAYTNWKIMMYESLVRACVLEHLRQNGMGDAAVRQVADDYRIGFTWSAELAILLRKYQSERQRFKTFDDFIPLVAAFFARERAKLPAPPRLVSIRPNGVVDAATTEMVLTFDQPMRDKSWSMLLDNAPFPEITGAIRYDRKRRVLTVPIKLKPATEYRFWLNSEERFGFISEKGIPLAPLRIRFRTR